MVRKEIIGDCELYKANCLDIMPALEKADLVITDPPYGITACEWDICIDMNMFWEKVKLKENSPCLIFSNQPYTTDCINSNRKKYKYSWYWIKNTKSNFLNAYKMPMRSVEEILVFYKKQPVYNPQNLKTPTNKGIRVSSSKIYRKQKTHACFYDLGLPTNTLFFSSIITGFTKKERFHPTQKPVPLLAYLIQTYTNQNEFVFDPFMGSGSTGVACIETGRRFIGIEKDERFFDIACKRIEAAVRERDGSLCPN